MGACRPLYEDEVSKVLKALAGDKFAGRWTLRNQALLWVGINTGFRISELLALRVSDVFQYGNPLEEISLPRRFMKGKKRGRTKRLYPPAKEAIDKWVRDLKKNFKGTRNSFLFTSAKGGQLSRVQAYRILNKAAVIARIPSKRIGTHTLRKTFADRMYDYYSERAKDGAGIDVMYMLMLELDHEDITTTYSYMEFKIDTQKPDDLFDKY